MAAIALVLNHALTACESAIADLQATAIASDAVHHVPGGGDMVSDRDLVVLANTAQGNSTAAIHSRLGLPSCVVGSDETRSEYWPVIPNGVDAVGNLDPVSLWVEVIFIGHYFDNWTYELQDPCK